MKDPENIREVAALNPDFMGFIFYPPSPRYAGNTLQKSDLDVLSPKTRKVGVFVDAPMDEVVKIAEDLKLDFIQLHGNESTTYARKLKRAGLGVIKVLSGNEGGWDMNYLTDMETSIDFWLIDYRSGIPGGTGKVFDRAVLNKHEFNRPVILSGGLDKDEVEKIIEEANPNVFGVDLNSKLEDRPGFKNLNKLNELINTIR